MAKIVEDNSKKVLEELNGPGGAVERILTMIGIKAERHAKGRCPTGTPESTGWKDKNGVIHPNKGYRGGTLKNSITFNVSDKVLTIGSNVEYAPYVELGTGPNFEPPPEWEQFDAPAGSGEGRGYVRPRPYLKPAITDHVDEYKNIMERELKK